MQRIERKVHNTLLIGLETLIFVLELRDFDCYEDKKMIKHSLQQLSYKNSGSVFLRYNIS